MVRPSLLSRDYATTTKVPTPNSQKASLSDCSAAGESLSDRLVPHLSDPRKRAAPFLVLFFSSVLNSQDEERRLRSPEKRPLLLAIQSAIPGHEMPPATPSIINTTIYIDPDPTREY